MKTTEITRLPTSWEKEQEHLRLLRARRTRQCWVALMLLLGALLVMMASAAQGSPESQSGGALVERVIDALIVVESGGRADAVGDGGRAIGCLQMWPVCVAEANRLIGRTHWTLADRTCPRESRAMARTILIWHYRRGVTDSVELGCRWRNPFSACPDWYRAKVRRALKEVSE